MEKDMKEWKLAQLFKLQAELAVFGSKCVPEWDRNLTSDKVQIALEEGSAPLSGRYAEMWYNARLGCLAIIDNATAETRDDCNWRLDKRLNLRRELEEYGMKILPELAAALGPNHVILRDIDAQWCDTWKMALDLVTDK